MSVLRILKTAATRKPFPLFPRICSTQCTLSFQRLAVVCVSSQQCSSRTNHSSTGSIKRDRHRMPPSPVNFNSAHAALAKYSKLRQRVDEKDVQVVLDALRKDLDQVFKCDLELLLRCCGRYMVRTPPLLRTQLLNELWDTIQESGAKIFLPMYNARLLSLLENNELFVVHKELAAMDSLNLEPNETTYQIMIDRLCEEGDLFTANEIRKHMNAMDMRISTNISHSFLRANILLGNMEAANTIRNLLAESGNNATEQTCAAVLWAYGQTGNVEAMKKVLNDAKESGMNITPNHLVAPIRAMARGGFEDQALELLPCMSVNPENFVNTLMNLAFELIHYGFSRMAQALFVIFKDSKHAESTGMALIASQMSQHRPVKEIVAMQQALNEISQEPKGVDELVRLALHNASADHMVQCIEMMSQEGFQVWSHFYKPALKNCCSAGDTEALLRAVTSMVKHCDDKEDVVEEILLKALPFLLDNNQLEALAHLTKIGLEPNHSNLFQTTHHLFSGNVSEALRLCNSHPIVMPNAVISRWSDSSFMNCKDYKSIMEFLEKTSSFHLFLVNMKLLTTIVEDELLSQTALEKTLNVFINKNMAFGDTIEKYQMLQKSLRARGILSTTIQDLDTLYNEALPDKGSFQKSRSQAQSTFTATKTDRDMFHVSFKKLETENFKHLLESWPSLFGILGNCPKCTDLVLMVATQLMQQDRADEAIEIIHYHAALCNFSVRPADEQAFFDLLKAAEQSCNLKLIGRLLDTLYNGYLWGGLSEKCLTHVWKFCFTSSKSTEDTTAVWNCCKIHVTDPLLLYLHAMCAFLQKEELDLLQKVVTFGNSVEGRNTMSHYLFFALVKSNDLKEAHKLLTSSSIRADNDLLQKVCKIFHRKEWIDSLFDVVKLTKYLPGCDRDRMLRWLVKLQAKRRNMDFQNALSVYKDEGIEPSRETLRFFDNVLQRADGSRTLSDSVEESAASSQKYDRFLEAIEVRSVEEVCNLTTTAFVATMQRRNPQKIPKYEFLVKSLAKRSLFGRQVLFELYVLEKEFQLAFFVLQDCDNLKKYLEVENLCRVSLEAKDVTTLTKLRDMLVHLKREIPEETYLSELRRVWVAQIYYAMDIGDLVMFNQCFRHSHADGIRIEKTRSMQIFSQSSN